MNTAPSVFTPVQPKGDGLSVPTLLSLLAHGVILGLLIYNYQADDLTATGSLETTMVSPEQLAAIQGQVLANRAAAQAAASSQSDSASDSNPSMAAPNDGTDNVNTSPQRRPVFTQSDEPVYTNSQQQQIIEKMKQYERELAESKREIDDEANQRIENMYEERIREQEALQRRLDAYQDSYDNPQPRIEKSKEPARNNDGDSGSSKPPPPLDLEADGTLTFSGSGQQSSRPSQSNNNNMSGGGGASDAQILGAIRKKFNPPAGKTGSVQLIITVDPNGRVINVESPDEDTVFSREAVRAAKAVGRFDIDSSHPQYPNISIIFNGSR